MDNKDTSWLLGTFQDGWADLMEGMGDKTTQVQNELIAQLEARGMPDIDIYKANISEGFLLNSYRSFVETKTFPGARTIVYIGKHGSDLFTSWRSYILPTINWRFILIYALVSIGGFYLYQGALIAFTFQSVIQKVLRVWDSSAFFSNIFQWWLLSCAFTIGFFIILFLIRRILEKNSCVTGWFSIGMYVSPFSYVAAHFVKGYGTIFIDDIKNLYSNIKVGIESSNHFLPILPTILGIFLVIIILVGALGHILKKNVLAFILVEPSLFDKDDITAMNLSVHKSILRALDNSGIDVSQLRIKERFTGGHRGEDV